MFDDYYVTKIIDFGLATEVNKQSSPSTQDTRTASCQGGDPRWISPNRLRDDKVKFEDDIYALGCVILMVCAIPYAQFESSPS